MPSTYSTIATQTLGTATNLITFSSIPQTYTDLILVANSIMSPSSDILIRVGNGSADSGSNYSRCHMFGYSGGVVSDRANNLTNIVASSYTNQGSIIANFNGYSNITTFKPVTLRNDISADITYASINMWRNTSAINTMTLSHPSRNFAVGSIFTLYGIKAA